MMKRVISRRTFLKAMAATGLSAVAVGLAEGIDPSLVEAQASALDESEASGEDASETRIVKTCCRACISYCGVLAHVRNGRVIKLEGDPDHPMSKGALCAKGLSGIQALYNPNRNKYPMQRVGERGSNEWKRITWDEALDTIAAQLMETYEKYGAECVFASTGGGGNPAFPSPCRFCNVFGTPNWFEPGAAQCYLPRQAVYALMWGGNAPSIADNDCPELHAEDAWFDVMVLWGTAPSNSNIGQGGRAVADLRANGMRTIAIDPRFTADASKAEIWLPIRPGTDTALALGWIRYILEHELYDTEMVMKWSNLPYLINPETKLGLRAGELGIDLDDTVDPDSYVVWDNNSDSAKPMAYPWDDALDPVLDGVYTVNGMECKTGFRLLKEQVEPYTLEETAGICWLDAGQIEKSIQLYTENSPSCICLGVATDQTPQSVQVAMAVAIIDMLMGNVNKPGALMNSYTKPVSEDVDFLKDFLTEEQLNKRLGVFEYKALLMWWTAHIPSVLDAIVTGEPYKPRVWLERSGNKLAMLGNASSWIEAFNEMDLIVHAYMYPTSFSAYADILIPTTEWLETNQPINVLNKVVVRQEATHLWETMDEVLYWSKLAKRCADLGHQGCIDSFNPEITGENLNYFDTLEESLDYRAASVGMTWTELVKHVEENGYYEAFPYDEWYRYETYKDLDEDGKPQGFGTGSKKLEIYAEGIVTLGRTGMPFSPYELAPASKDYEPLPYYEEPFESPLDTEGLAKEYPLVMTNGRLPYYHHSTLRNIPWLREIYPVPELWIHPTAAEQYGISQGDWVFIESQRGKIQAKALVTEGINPGVVYMERFWNPETLNTETHGWKEMNVNVLTKNDPPYNDVVGTYTLRGFLVKVSKADGPPEGIWYEPEDFKSWLPEPSDPTEYVEV